jgi:hypothetical protein
VSGLDLAVTKAGELFVAARDGPKRVMRVLRSADGAVSFLPSVTVAPVRAHRYTSQPSHCRRQSLVHASIATHRGGVTLTWADSAAGTIGSCGDL